MRFFIKHWRRVAWSLLVLMVAGQVAWSVMSRDVDRFLADFTLRVPKTATKVLDRNGGVLGVFAENLLDWPVAGKTGTTNDYADAWYVGFSTRIACGVWVGLETRKTIFPGADGGKVALPIWVDFMKVALAGTAREAFPVPDGMAWADVDRVTGLLASGDTQAGDQIRLAFKPGTAPTVSSTSEAILAAREAEVKASSLPMDTHVWGK